MKLFFPPEFEWGVSMSAYQTEGGNDNADWSEWEKQGKAKEVCNQACNSFYRYKEDNFLARNLGCRTIRLSVEWARIEPREGHFSQEALEHYRRVIEDAKAQGMKVQLTLWWWTSPQWFTSKYGFSHSNSVYLFVRYAKKVARYLGPLLDMVTVFNEPMVPLGMGYLTGQFPPGKRSARLFYLALRNMAKAYVEIYAIFHKYCPETLVGINYLYNWYQSKGLSVLESLVDRTAHWYRIELLGRRVSQYQDYFGIDYYRLGRMRFSPGKGMYFGFRIEENSKHPMGWIEYPRGIYNVIMKASKDHPDMPIYILENGKATYGGLDDQDRIKFISDHLRYVHKAIVDGASVAGYNYWSLIDNFEWLYGYAPKFGLVEVNFRTFQRVPRQSYFYYQNIIKQNYLDW
jgi:beta-glucosidase